MPFGFLSFFNRRPDRGGVSRPGPKRNKARAKQARRSRKTNR